MKITQKELVLTHVDSLVQYPLYGEFYLFSVHRFFPNVSLTPCRTQSMVKVHISTDHTDELAHKILSCKCEIIPFLNLPIYF